MNTKLIFLGAGLLLVAAVTILLFIRKRSEPTFEGKGLRYWVAETDNWQGSEDEPVAKAFRSMGTNSIPGLLKLLQTKDSAFKTWTLAPNARFPSHQARLRIAALLRSEPSDASDKRYSASLAFHFLGQDAISAVPSLTRLLQDPQTTIDAARALAQMGPQSIPTLLQAATNSHRDVRSSAIGALSILGPKAGPAVSELLKALGDQDYYVRSSAAWTLGCLGPEYRAAIFARLTRAMTDTHPNVRAKAAEALGKLGDPDARPILTEALNDPAPSVRIYATNSLKSLSSPTP